MKPVIALHLGFSGCEALYYPYLMSLLSARREEQCTTHDSYPQVLDVLN